MNGTATLAKTWYIAFSGEKKKYISLWPCFALKDINPNILTD